MKIKLIIYSNLKRYVKGYDDDNGIVKEVSHTLSIKQFLEDTINHPRALDAISMVLVNNKVVPFKKLEQNLQDNDIIKVYPPMGGG
ncbi:MAG: MoaD/ThiS family protein [Candidatus Caldatribacteriota bacterium]|jgi:sulfur carrier protein ThiS|nr:MoaD/ThiS family protein [Atribacterota bacterium]MDD3641627.1 MoaD/ThiS family protein [Atribacterota bacterium]MDD4288422.1 MoaD/ThiS family protein [Atribacterota bacterium]MDD4765258.1 MoaD/ThiS family protein [Atribacterota bacterium]MDI9597158.1 MoaD/ThiS family protein [Atribacterota bacterium]